MNRRNIALLIVSTLLLGACGSPVREYAMAGQVGSSSTCPVDSITFGDAPEGSGRYGAIHIDSPAGRFRAVVSSVGVWIYQDESETQRAKLIGKSISIRRGDRSEPWEILSAWVEPKKGSAREGTELAVATFPYALNLQQAPPESIQLDWMIEPANAEPCKFSLDLQWRAERTRRVPY